MKNRLYIPVIVFSGISLLGILVLQAYWIQQSWKLKESEFDQSVMNGLEEVSRTVSRREVVRILNTETDSVATHQQVVSYHTDSVKIISDVESGLKFADEISRRTVRVVQRNSSAMVEGLERLGDDLEKLDKHTQKIQIEIEDWMDSGGSKKPDETKMLSGLGMEVMDTLSRSGIFKPVMLVENLVSEIIISMDRKGLNIEQKIGPDELDSVLKKEFSARKLPLNYTYEVYNTGRRKVVMSANGNTQFSGATDYHVSLSGVEGNLDELYVSFPDKRNHVLHSMTGIIIISAVMALLALTGFVWLVRMLGRQQKISAMKTQFINNMTHEFKTPLATTLVAAGTLNNPAVYTDPEQVKKYTDLIKEENRIMNRHIETVLQAALLDKEKLVMHMTDVYLPELLQKTIDGLEFFISQAHAQVTLSVAGNPVAVKGDADRLQQVFTNLVTNSVKYSDQPPVIKITVSEEGKYVVVEVADNGIGIPRKNQKYIFDAFYRVNTGDLHNVKGFGLGLNYVKKIMDYHNGRIELRSEPGKGSAFRLKFRKA